MEYLVYPNEPKCQQKQILFTKLGLRFASRDTLKHAVLHVQHTYEDSQKSTENTHVHSYRATI